MNWLSVRVRPSGSSAAAIGALFEMGSMGVHETDTDVITHFEGDANADAITAAVRAADPGADVVARLVPAVDWTEEWKKGVRAHELGTLAIVPPWLADGRDPERTVIIEPEMAFGTGEHETTRGVVRLLPSMIRAGDRVADLGAGSAVLSIAAAKLGASQVTAIELDHDAIANARENVERNCVSHVVTVIEGDAAILLPLVAPVRVVVANIISSVLRELLPAVAAALTSDGEAALSGILLEERDAMLAFLASEGWSVLGEDQEGMWWSARIARR